MSRFRGPEFARSGGPESTSGEPEFVTLSLSGGPEFMPGTIGYFVTLSWPGGLKFTSGGPESITLSRSGGPEYVSEIVEYFVTLSLRGTPVYLRGARVYYLLPFRVA